ncbi:MAG: RdgB/HAM1 family non-canonical purine NTP pyrophosphatase [Planctomycetota bacterium]
MRKILVASTNPGKLRELREMLGGDIEWVGLSDFPNIGEIEEGGETFAENARKKALGYAKATGLWTLADDSGLVVDALGGRPGVKSARFAGYLPPRHPLPTACRGRQDTKEKRIKVDMQTPGFSERRATSDERRTIDRENFEKVLKLLEGVPKEKRTARFVCCLCLASPEKVLIETEGKLEGVIIDEPIGENGFGYDPIFWVPKLKKTVAQLDSEQKNAVSHRENAIRKLKTLLFTTKTNHRLHRFH